MYHNLQYYVRFPTETLSHYTQGWIVNKMVMIGW
jgi:hypothetical protein